MEGWRLQSPQIMVNIKLGNGPHWISKVPKLGSKEQCVCFSDWEIEYKGV